MKILAVDPGYDRLGVAVMEKRDGKEVLLHSECLQSDKRASLPERLVSLGDRLERLLETHGPEAVAIETLYFSKNQTTALSVAEARGMIVYLAKKHGCRVLEFGPKEVKLAVTGYGNSDKRAIAAMLGRLVANLPARALDDEYDAIAIGITALAHGARYDKILSQEK